MNKFFFLIFIVFFLGCKKDTYFNNSQDLIGKWTWIKTCAGITTGTPCWTPSMEGYTESIEYTPDSICNFFLNDTLRKSSKFHTFKDINSENYTIYFVKYDSGSTEMYSISYDTLKIINSEGVLTTTSHYKKIK